MRSDSSPRAARPPFWKRSIQIQENLIIVCLVTLTLGGLGVYDYLRATDSARLDLEQTARTMTGRLATTLVAPLWDVDREKAEGAVTAELEQDGVLAVLVRDEAGALFVGRGRDATAGAAAIEATALPEAGTVTARRDIVKDNAVIGSVEAALSSRLIERERAAAARAILLRIALTDLLLVVGLTLSLRKTLIDPLRALGGFAARVSQGDFDRRLTGAFHGELAELKTSLELMVTGLRGKMLALEDKERESLAQADMARQAQREAEAARRETEARGEKLLNAAAALGEVVAKVHAAARQLADQVGVASRGAGEQKHRVVQTAQAMDELNATIVEAARNASVTADLAEAARTTADGGVRVVEDSIKAIEDAKRQSAALKAGMEALGRQVQGIEAVLEVITDIADQTNLLALNAAIEAARAGESGRGFAVVADEVRKLAEKTMAATKQVGQDIQAIRSGAQTSVAMTENAAALVDKAAAMSLESGRSLTEIVGLVNRATDQTRTIAAIAERQSASSEQIMTAVEQVSDIAADTARVMEQSTAAVADLSALAKDLAGMVEMMRRA